MYAAAGTLRGVAFDLRRLKVVGTSVPVLSPIVTLPTGTAEFDVADDGTLVYLSGGAGTAQRTLVWVDRQGHEEPIKAAAPRFYGYPRLSPDGKRIAVDIRDQDNDIWVFDVSRETLQRVTSDPGSIRRRHGLRMDSGWCSAPRRAAKPESSSARRSTAPDPRSS